MSNEPPNDDNHNGSYFNNLGDALVPKKFRKEVVRSACDTAANVVNSGVEILDTLKSKGEKMALELNKIKEGDSISLNKDEKTTNYAIGLDWQEIEGAAVDCDVSALLLASDGKPIVRNGKRDSKGCMVYYSNLTLPGIRSYGDNRTGNDDEIATTTDNDEQIDINLDAVDSDVAEIAIIVTTYVETPDDQKGAINRGPILFKDAAHPILTIYTNDNSPVARYQYNLEDEAADTTCIVIGKFIRQGSDWVYRACAEKIGTSKINNGIMELAEHYGVV